MHITQKEDEEEKKLKDVTDFYGNLKSGRAETRKAKTICGNAYYPSEIYLIFLLRPKGSPFLPFISLSPASPIRRTWSQRKPFFPSQPLNWTLHSYTSLLRSTISLFIVRSNWTQGLFLNKFYHFFFCLFFILFHLRCNSTVPDYSFYSLLSEGKL